jgi:hypothetical protein
MQPFSQLFLPFALVFPPIVVPLELFFALCSGTCSADSAYIAYSAYRSQYSELYTVLYCEL